MNIINFVKGNAKTIVKTVIVGGAITAIGIGAKILLNKEATGLPEGYDGLETEVEEEQE